MRIAAKTIDKHILFSSRKAQKIYKNVDDTKGVSRSRSSNNDIHYNDIHKKKKKQAITVNGLQKDIQKTKD